MDNRGNSPGTDKGKPAIMNDPRYIVHIDVQISLTQYQVQTNISKNNDNIFQVRHSLQSHMKRKHKKGAAIMLTDNLNTLQESLNSLKEEMM